MPKRGSSPAPPAAAVPSIRRRLWSRSDWTASIAHGASGHLERSRTAPAPAPSRSCLEPLPVDAGAGEKERDPFLLPEGIEVEDVLIGQAQARAARDEERRFRHPIPPGADRRLGVRGDPLEVVEDEKA